MHVLSRHVQLDPLAVLYFQWEAPVTYLTIDQDLCFYFRNMFISMYREKYSVSWLSMFNFFQHRESNREPMAHHFIGIVRRVASPVGGGYVFLSERNLLMGETHTRASKALRPSECLRVCLWEFFPKKFSDAIPWHLEFPDAMAASLIIVDTFGARQLFLLSISGHYFSIQRNSLFCDGVHSPNPSWLRVWH